MNLTTEHAHGVAVVRVGESRLMYPLLSEFSTAVTQLIAGRRAEGRRGPVVGRLRRQRHDRLPHGPVSPGDSRGRRPEALRRPEARVETMLTMTGAQNFIEVHPDEPSAVKSFGA